MPDSYTLGKRIISSLAIIFIFLIGWFASSVYSNYSFNLTQSPFAASKERLSPADHVKESQIRVYNDRIIIDIDNAIWARYADTNSMDPLFDSGANGIEIKPEKPENLHIGDIIAYKAGWTDGTVIHRIIDTGYDSQGWYAIAKGDNNPIADPQPVRFSQVEYLLIGIIY